MDLDILVNALDLVGTFAFALVGARIAADKGLDYGGITFSQRLLRYRAEHFATFYLAKELLGFFMRGYSPQSF